MAETPSKPEAAKPTREQLIENIVAEAIIKDPEFVKTYPSERDQKQAIEDMIKTANEIVADPAYRAQEAAVKASDDAYSAIARSIKQAHINDLRVDGKTDQPTLSFAQNSRVPISQRSNKGVYGVIITPEENKTLQDANALSDAVEKQAIDFIGESANNGVEEPFAIKTVKNAVTGSADNRLFFMEGDRFTIAWNDLENEGILKKLKETHPKLFGADGKLPEEVKDALRDAQENDGITTPEEYKQIETQVVPNVKPAAVKTPQ
jgi:hypothetical protein